MNRKCTLSAWRNPTAVKAVTDISIRNGSNVSLRQLIMLAAQIQEWFALEQLLGSVADEAKTRDKSEWRSTSILERGAGWHITKEGQSYQLQLSETVTLTLTATKYLDHPLSMEAVLRFPNGEAGKKFLDAVAENEKRDQYAFAGIAIGGVEFAPELFIKGSDQDDRVFAKGSEELLGERVRVLEQSTWHRDRLVYEIKPLPGEAIVFYEDSNATHQLGLMEPREKERLMHPDANVFASVGPLSLALKMDDAPRRQTHQRLRDRITVFEDAALPITPVKRDEPWDDEVTIPEDGDYYDRERFDEEY